MLTCKLGHMPAILTCTTNTIWQWGGFLPEVRDLRPNGLHLQSPQLRTNSLPALQTLARSPLRKPHNILHPLSSTQAICQGTAKRITNAIYTDYLMWFEYFLHGKQSHVETTNGSCTIRRHVSRQHILPLMILPQLFCIRG